MISQLYIQKHLIKAALVFILFFCSCTKNKHPNIKIISPTNGQVFNAGDIIEISADLQDSDALSSEYLVVTKVSITNDTVINFQDHQFMGNAYTYHLIKSFTSEANTQYKIVVSGYGHSTLSSDSIFVKAN